MKVYPISDTQYTVLEDLCKESFETNNITVKDQDLDTVVSYDYLKFSLSEENIPTLKIKNHRTGEQTTGFIRRNTKFTLPMLNAFQVALERRNKINARAQK